MKVMLEESLSDYIKRLEREGEIDPFCKMCIRVFYPQLMEGKRISDIFAPGHKASKRCESDKRPHCTCDTCF